MTNEPLSSRLLPESNLKGKIALVSGASQGIGLAVSKLLAAQGVSVMGVARDTTQFSDALNASESHSNQHYACNADLSSAKGRQQLKAALLDWGYPHIVVANVYARQKNHTLASDVSTQQTNTYADGYEENIQYLLDILPEVLAFQRSQKFGRWIAVSSIVAELGSPGQSRYSMIKASLTALMKTLAVEEGKHYITANTVVPGLIETAGVKARYAGSRLDALAQMNVVGRAGTPMDVAHAIAFLASPMAGYITGVSLPVCGGMDLGWSLQSPTP